MSVLRWAGLDEVGDWCAPTSKLQKEKKIGGVEVAWI